MSLGPHEEFVLTLRCVFYLHFIDDFSKATERLEECLPRARGQTQANSDPNNVLKLQGACESPGEMLKLSPSPQPPFSRSGLGPWRPHLEKRCCRLVLRFLCGLIIIKWNCTPGPPVTSFRGLCTVTHEQASGSVGFNTKEGLLVLEKPVRWTVCEN